MHLQAFGSSGQLTSQNIKPNDLEILSLSLQAFGSSGQLTSHNIKPYDLEFRTMEGQETSPIYPDFLSRYEVAYRLELDHFLNLLEGINTPSKRKKETPHFYLSKYSAHRK